MGGAPSMCIIFTLCCSYQYFGVFVTFIGLIVVGTSSLLTPGQKCVCVTFGAFPCMCLICFFCIFKLLCLVDCIEMWFNVV
jgi:hypothetical protein